MRLFSADQPLSAEFRNAIVAIGNFDGLHRGHQELLAIAREQAAREGRSFGIITFEPHPRTFFKPDEPVFRLTPLPLKARLAAALGASFILNINFDAELSNLEPRDFVQRYLVEHLAASHVVTGYDFHFGKGRKGNPTVLKELGSQMGFGVTIVDQVSDEGDIHSPFSSSSIRSALRHGHMATAAKELGYFWTAMGEVVHGDQRGRAIGFPTANIILEKGVEPFRGIYAVRVRDAARRSEPAWAGAGYFGDRPTFETMRTFLEVYLLDFDGDLYGKILMVEFIDLIRPDKRFHSTEELKAQMAADCDAARQLLARVGHDNPNASFPLSRAQQGGAI
jgi:riboflavin kinase / FMN adenylyltransferase